MSATLSRAESGFLAHAAGAGLAARAAENFRRLGLPTARTEAWKYTSLRALAALVVAPAASSAAPLPNLPALTPLPDLPRPDLPRLVFINGPHRPDLSTVVLAAPAPLGLARPERDPFAALNAMFANDAHIAVPAGHDAGTILLLCVTLGDAAPIAAHPRHRITLGQGARLTLLDISAGAGTYLDNPVIEIVLQPNASLTHLRLQDAAPGAFSIATLYADLAAGSAYHALSLGIGAALARAEAHVALSGANATFTLEAAQALSGRQHGDITTVVAHDAPNGRSRQTIRNVLGQAARGVFQGRIDVARAAQKTDGYQMNHALLLSPDAEIDSKPELRINADDVKCSHGATVGELDPNQIFYLRSRGLNEAEARAMLISGFLAEPLATIENQAVRGIFDAALARGIAGLST